MTYSVDTIGRVNQVKGSLNQVDTVYVSGVSYAAHGPMKSWTVGASGTEAWTWNQRLQPKTIKHGSALDLELYYCSNDAGSCAANQGSPVKQSLKHLDTSLQYKYTTLDQVASVEEETSSASCWKREFGYKNQLGIQGSTYDSSGNLSSIGEYGFQWDAEGRLRSRTLNGLVTTCSYDGEGRRVRKWTGSSDGPVTYAYDALGQLAAEYGEGQALGTQYVAVDWLGSVWALTNGITANERHDYEPFGEELPAGLCGRGPTNYYSGGDSLMRFNGKERDAETGLDYFGARYFSAAQGRFTTPDPLMASAHVADPQSWNRYSYARNNPLRFIDPDGLKELSAEECAKTQGCVTVNLNVIYDSNAQLTNSQRAQFKNQILQNAKDEYGDRKVHFAVAETSGAVQMKGGKIAAIEGLQRGSVNVVLTDTNVIRDAGSSGESNGIAAALINTYRADSGTLSHELAHLFLGHANNALAKLTSAASSVDPFLGMAVGLPSNLLLEGDVGSARMAPTPAQRQGYPPPWNALPDRPYEGAKRYSVPPDPQALRPRQ